jgi:AbrB family looped-hinge helix DNA binding protein
MEAEAVVRVSTKGQVVIPKEVRDKVGIVPGGKLLVAVRDKDILLRSMENVTLREASGRLSKEDEKRRVDVDALVGEAIRWARK